MSFASSRTRQARQRRRSARHGLPHPNVLCPPSLLRAPGLMLVPMAWCRGADDRTDVYFVKAPCGVPAPSEDSSWCAHPSRCVPGTRDTRWLNSERRVRLLAAHGTTSFNARDCVIHAGIQGHKFSHDSIDSMQNLSQSTAAARSAAAKSYIEANLWDSPRNAALMPPSLDRNGMFLAQERRHSQNGGRRCHWVRHMADCSVGDCAALC